MYIHLGYKKKSKKYKQIEQHEYYQGIIRGMKANIAKRREGNEYSSRKKG